MNYSGYQIETVLRQIRRLRGLFLPAGHRDGADSVAISDEGRERARTVHLAAPGEPPRTVVAIYDRRRYPPAVERELDRRAASFLDPAEEDPGE